MKHRETQATCRECGARVPIGHTLCKAHRLKARMRASRKGWRTRKMKDWRNPNMLVSAAHGREIDPAIVSERAAHRIDAFNPLVPSWRKDKTYRMQRKRSQQAKPQSPQ